MSLKEVIFHPSSALGHAVEKIRILRRADAAADLASARRQEEAPERTQSAAPGASAQESPEAMRNMPYGGSVRQQRTDSLSEEEEDDDERMMLDLLQRGGRRRPQQARRLEHRFRAASRRGRFELLLATVAALPTRR